MNARPTEETDGVILFSNLNGRERNLATMAYSANASAASCVIRAEWTNASWPGVRTPQTPICHAWLR